jgi:hypothetical protein
MLGIYNNREWKLIGKISKWSGASIVGKGKLVEAFQNGKNSPISMVEKTKYIHLEC